MEHDAIKDKNLPYVQNLIKTNKKQNNKFKPLQEKHL